MMTVDEQSNVEKAERESRSALAPFVRRLARSRGLEKAILRVRDRFGRKRHNSFIVCGAAPWKHGFLSGLLNEYGANEIHFVHRSISTAELKRLMIAQRTPVFVCWGMRETGDFSDFAVSNNIPLWRLEDGFIRSIGLGARHIPPASLIIDKTGGIHFRSDRPSELEIFLSNHAFTIEETELARRRIDEIVSLGLTKYNLDGRKTIENISDTQENILVFGQVEDDASVEFGSPLVKTNAALLDLVLEQYPNANIFYRPHPDVTAGLRRAKSSVQKFQSRVTMLDGKLAIWDLIHHFDRVCVMTSLAGFEALIRGVPVNTYGMPFYAGWGVTTDFLPARRRTRTLSVEELFFGAYVHAATYLDPKTGRHCQYDDVIKMLSSG